MFGLILKMEFFIFLSQKIDFYFFSKSILENMEEIQNLPIRCFNCMKSYKSITYRAFDQNFCCKDCMDVSIEINTLFDYGFNNPNFWIKESTDILTAKKDLEFKKVKKICTSLVQEIITNTVKTVSILPKPIPIQAYKAQSFCETKHILTPPFGAEKISKAEHVRFNYNVKLTPPPSPLIREIKNENPKKKIKFGRNSCNFEGFFDRINSLNIKIPIPFPSRMGTICSFIPLEEWNFQ